ncbi:MAG: hypothetical protein WC141_00100 [Arcobacteraceae bacterium]
MKNVLKCHMFKFSHSFIKKFGFLSVVFSFFFVNGIVYVLDAKFGYFDIVHSTILRNIESAYDTNEKSSYSHKADSVVILISNALFEKEFNSQTPLNKERLTILVDSILKQKPKNLIFDLDISPDYNFIEQNGNIYLPLYSTLATYSKQTNIFLPFTFIAQTAQNKSLKYEWFTNMCQNNINFGFPFIFNEIGSVLQYKEYEKHIALSAFNSNNHRKVCLENSVGFEEMETIVQNHFKEFDTSESIPINYQALNESTLLLNSFEELSTYDFANKTVFLGGGYGFDDKYITPSGEKFGVEILNAIFYTLSHKIDHNNGLLTLVIFDLSLGLSFGMFIGFVLKRRVNANLQSSITFYNLLTLFIMMVYFIISLNITAYLFHNLYLWLNPIPLLIGMFIDAIIGLGEKETVQKQPDRYIFVVHAIKVVFVGFGMYGLFVAI